MRFLLPVIANLLLFLSACGTGSATRPLIPRTFSKIERLVIIALAGIGLNGILLFLLGTIRFSPTIILAFLLPAAVVGSWCLSTELRGTVLARVFSGLPIVPASVIATVLLASLLAGFADPVGDITENTSDAVAYHYLGPKVWLREGVIRPVLDECLTSFPATVEVQFAALTVVGGQSAPELFAVIPLVLILLLAAVTARRIGLDPACAWWAAALISAMPTVYRGLYGGMIDVIYAAFVILAARIALDSELPRDYVLVGLFCGFAMGTKYTGLIAVALLVVCLFVFASNSFGRLSWRNCRHLAIVCLVAALFSSPWYIRNWLVLGSPIYPPTPLLAGIFHVNYFPPEAVQKVKNAVLREGFGMGKDLLSLLLLPFRITFHPANFENGAGGIGLVPLAFVPFCFPALRWERFSKALVVFAILTTVAWFYTEQESRFLIHIYVLAAIFGVAGWGYVVRVTPRLGRLLAVLTVTISISYGLFMIVAARADDIHAVISKSYAEARRHKIPFLESFEYLNKEPSVSKVLVLDPHVPTYYLDKEYLKPVGRWGEHPFPGIENPEQALSLLSSQGDITHVLDVRFNDGEFRLPEHPEHLVLIFEAKDQRVYRVARP